MDLYSNPSRRRSIGTNTEMGPFLQPIRNNASISFEQFKTMSFDTMRESMNMAMRAPIPREMPHIRLPDVGIRLPRLTNIPVQRERENGKRSNWYPVERLLICCYIPAGIYLGSLPLVPWREHVVEGLQRLMDHLRMVSDEEDDDDQEIEDGEPFSYEQLIALDERNHDR